MANYVQIHHTYMSGQERVKDPSRLVPGRGMSPLPLPTAPSFLVSIQTWPNSTFWTCNFPIASKK